MKANHLSKCSCLLAFILFFQPQSIMADQDSERVINFPPDHSLGTLSARAVNSGGMQTWKILADVSFRGSYGSVFPVTKKPGWTEIGQAMGDVPASSGKDVHLVVTETAGANLLPLANLQADDIQSLNLQNSRVTNDELVHLKSLTFLRILDLSNTQITNAGLANLASLQALETLDLSDTKISNDGMRVVGTLPSLKALNLAFTDIGDDGVLQLQNLDTLQMLGLRFTKVTDRGLESLRDLRELRVLMLGGNAITDAGLANIEGLASLRILDLGHTPISNVGVPVILKLTTLEQLNVVNSSISDSALVQLMTDLPDCLVLADWGKRGVYKIIITILAALLACIALNRTVRRSVVHTRSPAWSLLGSMLAGFLLWSGPILWLEIRAYHVSRDFAWYTEYTTAIIFSIFLGIALFFQGVLVARTTGKRKGHALFELGIFAAGMLLVFGTYLTCCAFTWMIGVRGSFLQLPPSGLFFSTALGLANHFSFLRLSHGIEERAP